VAIANLLRFTTGSILLLFLLVANISAAEPCATVVGRLATLEGKVEVQRTGSPNWQAGVLGGDLCQGDTVRAGASSRATIALINQAVLRVDQNTAMRLDNISGVTEERSVLSLFQGAFQSFSRKPRGFEVNTPYLNGSIEGTEFVFRVKDGQSELTVLEGLVVASNSQGKVSVSGGESAVGEQGKAPYSRTVVRPRDAVQWSLYYPPVMATGAQARAADPEAQASLQNAASLLYVGRVDEAQANIDKALQLDPNAGLAYALRAVINVVQNNNDQALADGNQAVALSPDSSAAKIALSYAQQAAFDIPAARDTLQQAVQQQPDDALALARLAELQLMLGDRKQARESARQAAVLDPNLARTQMILGFAALAEFRNEEATTAFERAIDLSSAEPMAHLGLGLAKISNGELEAGGRDIEVAVALDSNNALMRAYLGKTYFEEKRTPLDIEQFDIAKQLDPNDPTAYLYSGIAKQTENRPIEAVQDLEQSIELNDNRAVFRSRLLLDKDRAARGTSLARAYKDLGFLQLGVNESTKSLTLDPSNSSAHRFLSDSYQGVRRREIARVSELLQAQLMQDVNINPVQPSLSVTNLNIATIGGPAAAGFNEFTPLFQRNKAQLNVSGFGGNNDTYGGEAVASAVYGSFSLSVGAYSYDSDGWRDNNHLDQNIYNVFAQWAVTPELNVQAEFRRREAENGDLNLNFDPDDFSEVQDNKDDQDMARFGLRYSPSPSSTFLFSYIYVDLESKIKDAMPFDPVPLSTFSTDTKTDSSGYLAEGQYIFQSDGLNLIAGGAYSAPDTDIDEFVSLDHPVFGNLFSLQGERESDIEQKRGYVYANLEQMDSVTWTVGASYDDYQEGPVDKTSFNPKAGVAWDINEGVRLRAAAFKVLKPALVNNRTIEPTQVAGFNQFFDDAVGTKYKRYGVGADWRVNQQLAVGAEATWRDLDEIVTTVSPTGAADYVTEDRDEQLHKVYLNWTPLEQVAVSAEFVYDRYESEDGLATDFGDRPKDVTTYRLPVTARYFSPSGFFAAVAGTYIDQDVDRSSLSTAAEGDDSFYLVDASVGYRFPKRRGIVSLGVSNLFDEDFEYLDDTYRFG
jgi:tetratricopeptide (TPR) repeat protein